MRFRTTQSVMRLAPAKVHVQHKDYAEAPLRLVLCSEERGLLNVAGRVHAWPEHSILGHLEPISRYGLRKSSTCSVVEFPVIGLARLTAHVATSREKTTPSGTKASSAHAFAQRTSTDLDLTQRFTVLAITTADTASDANHVPLGEQACPTLSITSWTSEMRRTVFFKSQSDRFWRFRGLTSHHSL